MNDKAIMAIEEFDAAITWQADHAEEAGAACTARVIRTLPKVRETNTELGRRMREWKGLTLKDAMPLRVTGGLHHLALTGVDERLMPVYAGEVTDQGAIDALVLGMVADHAIVFHNGPAVDDHITAQGGPAIYDTSRQKLSAGTHRSLL